MSSSSWHHHWHFMNLAIRVKNGGLLPALSDHPSLACALITISVTHPPDCNLSINVPMVILLSHALASPLSHVPSVAAFPTFILLFGVALSHLHLQFTISSAHSPPSFLGPVQTCHSREVHGSPLGLFSSPSWAASRDVSPPQPGEAVCQRRTVNWRLQAIKCLLQISI